MPAPALSSLHYLSSHHFLLPAHFLPPGGGRPLRRGDLAIRMGGGPRTYPGGVSKWQWKQMQAKKARQLLKARLARERQLYEMRKRAELRDAVAHLERPWDPDSVPAAVDAAPNLLSVAADDQLKALADRFHRPGGVDLWNDRDGPRVFDSPATGAASARFFPKNAVHSVQPYALLGAGDEAAAPRARGNAADLLLGRRDGAQGVCENADEEAYGVGDREPAVELTERDPVNALDDSDDSNWSLDEDDHATTSESEGMGDVGSWRERPAMVRRNGRNNGVARWDAVSAMAVGRDNDRGLSGDAFFSDSEGPREDRLDRSWQERSRGGSTRKRAGGRWNALNTVVGSRATERSRRGSSSFSDSEVIHGGSDPKCRTRNRDDTMNGRWNAPIKNWIGNEFNSNSESARGDKLEPRWGARNKLNGRENRRGRSKPKFSADTNDGERPTRYTRDNNGDEHTSGHGGGFAEDLEVPTWKPRRMDRSRNNKGDGRYQFGGGFAEDLEVPTWKPRRMDRARNNNGGKDDNMGGTFRRGDNRASRRLHANPANGSEDGRRRNGVRRFWGDEYSLRPTSELRSSWRETGSDGK
ncbi:uncharacterized protein LOC133919112 [Phragmites australis]|uniref:uncharacterized protein LOC133919112 n=1 Tax=Phragmites australis TaxID=29695 RepID=UPI002D77A212|nr:uncharacterized protein LOC133919112 [Phragmites australis]